MKKGLLIAAGILMVVGVVIFIAVLAASGFHISNLGTAKYETNTHTIEESIQKIELSTDTADIAFKLAEGEACQVVCVEEEKVKHAVSVEKGTIKIKTVDTRKWYEHLTFYSKPTSVTLYLPRKDYEAVSVKGTTGDVSVPKDFSFGSISIEVSTGDVCCEASASGLVSIASDTGDIKMNGVNASEVNLVVTTGHITLNSIHCEGNMSIKVDTGKSVLTDVTAENFTTEGDTGKIALRNVVVSKFIDIKRDTGDVTFDKSDAAEIKVRTTTGDVTGTLNSQKVFFTQTSTGKIRVPKTTSGGKCEITTDTGDIEIDVIGE